MPDNDETFNRVLPGNQVEQLASVSDRILRKKEHQSKQQQQGQQQHAKQHKNIEEQLEQEKNEKITKLQDGHIDFHA